MTVKPTDYDVTTNLVISTDRRLYHVTLDSPPRRRKRSAHNPLDPYTRHIKFYYPAESLRRITQREDLARSQRRHLVTKAGPGLALTALNYRYSWRTKGGFAWEPVTVFDDGERVYIKLPERATRYDQPLLVVERGGEGHVVNYLVRDGFFVVDRLFSRARLVLSHVKRTGLHARLGPVEDKPPTPQHHVPHTTA